MPTDTEIAWAAGFFEGEGYFSAIPRQLKDGPRLYPFVGINNTDYEMLARFHEIVGVGRIETRSVAYSPFNAKPQWRWIAGKRHEAEHILQLFTPWLSTKRKARAAELFDNRGNLKTPHPQ
jgi:hypothetical protein